MADDVTINILKALADKTRLNIVRELAREQDCASCQKVSKLSTLSQPAMSHHFGKLVEAGIVIEEKDGKEKLYTLNRELLESSGIYPNII